MVFAKNNSLPNFYIVIMSVAKNPEINLQKTELSTTIINPLPLKGEGWGGGEMLKIATPILAFRVWITNFDV